MRSLLVKRHPGTSIQPKTRGVSVLTMELLRTWGRSRGTDYGGAEVAGSTAEVPDNPLAHASGETKPPCARSPT
jgi:hypothetical protein